MSIGQLFYFPVLQISDNNKLFMHNKLSTTTYLNYDPKRCSRQRKVTDRELNFAGLDQTIIVFINFIIVRLCK